MSPRDDPPESQAPVVVRPEDRPAPPPGFQPPPSTELGPPRGLLGLLLWPLQAAISLALRLFASFVAGVLSALLPGKRKDPDPPPPDPPPPEPPTRGPGRG